MNNDVSLKSIIDQYAEPQLLITHLAQNPSKFIELFQSIFNHFNNFRKENIELVEPLISTIKAIGESDNPFDDDQLDLIFEVYDKIHNNMDLQAYSPEINLADKLFKALLPLLTTDSSQHFLLNYLKSANLTDGKPLIDGCFYADECITAILERKILERNSFKIGVYEISDSNIHLSIENYKNIKGLAHTLRKIEKLVDIDISICLKGLENANLKDALFFLKSWRLIHLEFCNSQIPGKFDKIIECMGKECRNLKKLTFTDQDLTIETLQGLSALENLKILVFKNCILPSEPLSLPHNLKSLELVNCTIGNATGITKQLNCKSSDQEAPQLINTFEAEYHERFLLSNFQYETEDELYLFKTILFNFKTNINKWLNLLVEKLDINFFAKNFLKLGNLPYNLSIAILNRLMKENKIYDILNKAYEINIGLKTSLYLPLQFEEMVRGYNAGDLINFDSLTSSITLCLNVISQEHKINLGYDFATGLILVEVSKIINFEQLSEDLELLKKAGVDFHISLVNPTDVCINKFKTFQEKWGEKIICLSVDTSLTLPSNIRDGFVKEIAKYCIKLEALSVKKIELSADNFCDLAGMKSIKKLEFFNCNLQNLHILPPQLQTLLINECENIELPSFPEGISEITLMRNKFPRLPLLPSSVKKFTLCDSDNIIKNLFEVCSNIFDRDINQGLKFWLQFMGHNPDDNNLYINLLIQKLGIDWIIKERTRVFELFYDGGGDHYPAEIGNLFVAVMKYDFKSFLAMFKDFSDQYKYGDFLDPYECLAKMDNSVVYLFEVEHEVLYDYLKIAKETGQNWMVRFLLEIMSLRNELAIKFKVKLFKFDTYDFINITIEDSTQHSSDQQAKDIIKLVQFVNIGSIRGETEVAYQKFPEILSLIFEQNIELGLKLFNKFKDSADSFQDKVKYINLLIDKLGMDWIINNFEQVDTLFSPNEMVIIEDFRVLMFEILKHDFKFFLKKINTYSQNSDLFNQWLKDKEGLLFQHMTSASYETLYQYLQEAKEINAVWFFKPCLEIFDRRERVSYVYTKSHDGKLMIDIDGTKMCGKEGSNHHICRLSKILETELWIRLYIENYRYLPTARKLLNEVGSFIHTLCLGIEYEGLREGLDANAINSIFKLCPNIIELHIENSPSNYFLGILTGLSNLKGLVIKGCQSMSKLPVIPESLIEIRIENCQALSEEVRLDALVSILEKNIDQGLLLCSGFDIQNHEEIGNLLLKKLGLNYIIQNMPKIGVFLRKYKTVNESQRIAKPIIAALLERKFALFFNHHIYFPVGMEIVKMLQFLPPWVSINNLSLQTSKLSANLIEEEKNSFVDIPGIEIDELLVLFDKINFTDQQAPGFIDPTKLKSDGSPISVQAAKKGLELLLKRIKTQEIYTAVPNDENERSEWYLKLSYVLKLLIKLAKESEESLTVSNELIQLGSNGHKCGSRWMNQSLETVALLQGNFSLKAEGLEEIINFCLGNYIHGIIAALTFKITPKDALGSQPHFFNSVANQIKSHIGWLPAGLGVDLNDPLMPRLNIDLKPIINSYLSSIKLITFIEDKIKGELKSKSISGNLILEFFNQFAEIKLHSKLLEINQTLEKKKIICGSNQATYLLKECMMLKAIVEDDKEAMANFRKTDLRTFGPLLQREARKRKTEEAAPGEDERPLKKLKSEIHTAEEVKGPNIKRKAGSDLAEEHERKVKKQKIESDIEMYSSFIDHPESYVEQLQALGHDAAHTKIRQEKENLISEFLAEEALVTLDDLTGEVHVTASGILVLLQHLGYLA